MPDANGGTLASPSATGGVIRGSANKAYLTPIEQPPPGNQAGLSLAFGPVRDSTGTSSSPAAATAAPPGARTSRWTIFPTSSASTSGHRSRSTAAARCTSPGPTSAPASPTRTSSTRGATTTAPPSPRTASSTTPRRPSTSTTTRPPTRASEPRRRSPGALRRLAGRPLRQRRHPLHDQLRRRRDLRARGARGRHGRGPERAEPAEPGARAAGEAAALLRRVGGRPQRDERHLPGATGVRQTVRRECSDRGPGEGLGGSAGRGRAYGVPCACGSPSVIGNTPSFKKAYSISIGPTRPSLRMTAAPFV